MSDLTQQLQKMKTAPGFIAALDQSGGSTPKALLAYGLEKDAWHNDQEMYSLVHQMRTFKASLKHQSLNRLSRLPTNQEVAFVPSVSGLALIASES